MRMQWQKKREKDKFMTIAQDECDVATKIMESWDKSYIRPPIHSYIHTSTYKTHNTQMEHIDVKEESEKGKKNSKNR